MEVPTDQVPCKTTGISNLHCALHTHIVTNAKSVLTFETFEVPTDQVPCKTTGISNLHCTLHTHIVTNAKSVLTFEIGVKPW